MRNIFNAKSTLFLTHLRYICIVIKNQPLSKRKKKV